MWVLGALVSLQSIANEVKCPVLDVGGHSVESSWH